MSNPRRAAASRVSAALLMVMAASVSMTVPAMEIRAGLATVIDGATLEIAGRRTALWGIAAPDPESAAGWAARLFLAILIAGAPVSCAPKAPERWLCLTAAGSDLASLLVQTGQARATIPYYHPEQARARAAGLGLWRRGGGGER